MPNEELLQRKQAQLNKEIRVGSSHKASELRRKDQALYNVQALEGDINELNDILGSRELQLSDEEKARLEAIKDRNISTLFLMQEKTFGDSKRMKEVKKAVADIEVHLHDGLQGHITSEALDEILLKYGVAVFACKSYLEDKEPSYPEGQNRYRQVRLNMTRLCKESEELRVAKELLKTGVLDGNVQNIHALLVQAKVYNLTKGGDPPQDNAPVREAFPEATLKTLGPETNVVYSIFSGKELPTAAIKRLSKSRDKREQSLARELPGFISGIRGWLSEFKEGKVWSKSFLIGEAFLSVTQNVHGQLTLTIGKQNIPIERNAGTLTDVLGSDIVINQTTYGREAGEQVITRLLKDYKMSDLNAEKRQLLMEYVSQRSGLPLTRFSNFYTNELAGMIYALRAHKNIYLIKRGTKIRRHLTEKDVVFEETEGRRINVVEARELLQQTEAQKESVKDKVVFERGNRQDKKQENIPEEEKDWNEKEKKVIKLLSDVMFSYETWIADEHMEDPGRRLKAMLLKNPEAIAELISDVYRRGENRQAFINSLIDKLPLFELEKQEADDFKNNLARVIDDITTAINKQVAEKTGLQLAGKLVEIEDWEKVKIKRKKNREEQAKEREKNRAKKEDESSIAYFLRMTKENAADIIRLATETQEDLEEKAFDALNLPYTAALDYLADPEKLLKGGTSLNIPSLKNIIEEMELKDFAEAEKTIDNGVNAASKMIQDTVKKYSGELFKTENEPQYAPLPDPDEPGIAEEEKNKRQRDKIRIGNERLNKMAKDSVAGGRSGQGLFTKLVFEQYFSGVETMDKRAMLASMIRNSKPAGKLLNTKEENLSPQEKSRREAYNEKVRTGAMGNYIGGLLKGAGPLFQKMMQGLPMEGLPEELKSAVEDMKSRLAPIPEEIVEAELYSIVKRSHGQIRKITVVKPLGAASVGQTFLCRLTKADGTEEETAIKLLKPDVRNRMKRERELMVNCARETDIRSREQENLRRQENGRSPLPAIGANEKGGMQVTYEGQLLRIEEELDLKIEAGNVELGKVYDKAVKEEEKNVTSMKTHSLIPAQTNALALEKAPGETYDALLTRISEELERLRKPYEMMGEDGKPVMEVMPDGSLRKSYYTDISNILTLQEQRHNNVIRRGTDEYKAIDSRRIADKMAGLLVELKKKKGYLETFANKWVREGVFDEGFYHGDPHSGNIMVSDDRLTIIDYGNCTKLDENQQYHVTRMLFAASVGDMETFRSDFHALLKPEFESLYQDKRAEFGRTITEIFSLGDRRSSGARIAVALLKAQEMGLEIPPAVYNFSQSQMRLQNTVDEVNKLIEELEKEVVHFRAMKAPGNMFDLTDREGDIAIDADESLSSLEQGQEKELMRYSDNREEIKEFILTDPDEFEQKTELRNIKIQYEGMNLRVQQFSDIVTAMNFLRVEGNYPEDLIPRQIGIIKDQVKTNYRSMRLLMDESILSEMNDCINEEPIDMSKVNTIISKIESAKNAAAGINEVITRYNAFLQRRREIYQRHGNHWKPDDREKQDIEQLSDSFVDAFLPMHLEKIAHFNDFSNSFIRMTKKYDLNNEDDRLNKEEMECDMREFFEEHTYKKEEFMQAFTDVRNALENGLSESDPAAFELKKNNLRKLYREILTNRAREKFKLFSEAAEKKDKDFLDIMTDVITDETKSALSRLGLYKGWKYRKNLEGQRKLEERLKEGEAEGT